MNAPPSTHVDAPPTRLERAPEVRRRRLVGNVLHLPRQLAPANPVEALPGELEVAPLHVDGPALVPDDVDTVVDATDELLGGRTLGAGVGQGHVGHALDRHVQRRVGVRAAVGAVEAHASGDGTVELVPDEDTVAYEVEGLGLDALPVDGDRGQPVLDRPIARHLHER